MRFGEITVAESEGAILAHSVKHAEGMFKKGRVLSRADLALLAQSGVGTVFAARLERGDVPEDEAAAAVAQAIAGDSTVAQAPFTGRANLHAAAHGLAVVDTDRVRSLNRLHESLTLATVAPFEAVEARQMVATVKVIPFAVPREVLEAALAVVGNDPLLRVAPFRSRRAGLAITRLAQTKPGLIEKSEAAMRERIEALGGSLGTVETASHATRDVSQAITALHAAGHNPILVFGASAIVDRGDVIPAALVEAGGEVVHLGMPVDPGNLMMFGRLQGVPVLGVPSCARSPKLNGFDWVLARVMAGLHVSAQDIMDMGAGGLLKEIPSRPTPREGKRPVAKAPRIAAIVLAAGTSSRMGANKLLVEMDGRPMIRRTVEAVLSARVGPVIIVTGHQPERVGQALSGLAVILVHNERYADGLATSLQAGLGAVPGEADGAVICLGDMPLVQQRHIDRLVSAFSPADHRTICVPVHEGRRGNPVLWGRSHFPNLLALEGDRGARLLMDQSGDDIAEVAMPDNAILRDFDTPESLQA